MDASTPSLLRTPLNCQAHSHSTLSPTSDYLTQSTSSIHTTRSSRDPQALLLGRWYQISRDIATRQLSRKTVIALNRNLDEAEELLAWDVPERFSGTDVNTGGLGIVGDVFEHQKRVLEPPTAPRSRGFDAPDRVEQEGTDEAQVQQMGPMLEKITYLVDELRKRQEEFKHLHSILVAKAEKGAEEIVRLEQHIEKSEQDITDDESELTYLKLQLRMLEIEAAPHLSMRENDSLAEGIRRWKLDWADVDNRFRMRRRKDLGKTHSVNSSLSVDHKSTFPSR
ncbi:hypothetical protein MMC30_007866 [Trapelia coarctata]|nr:hypothetical protein [Trapelia coarctata]